MRHLYELTKKQILSNDSFLYFNIIRIDFILCVFFTHIFENIFHYSFYFRTEK